MSHTCSQWGGVERGTRVDFIARPCSVCFEYVYRNPEWLNLLELFICNGFLEQSTF